MTNLALGPIGIAAGLDSSPHSFEAIAAAEELGYPAFWLSGGPLPGLQTIVDLVQATRSIKIVSGIVAVDKYTPDDVTATYAKLEAEHPGRFTVGLGGAHGPKPLATLNDFFDRLDGVPVERRVLAALGPRMLELARERTAGAYPFLIAPEYTAQARSILGEGKLLALNHLVVVETDAAKARAIAREPIGYLSKVPGYAASLTRQGFSADEIANLDDRLVDALTAWGTPAQIAAKLDLQRQAGADHIALNVLTGVTGPQPIEQWRTLADTLLS